MVALELMGHVAIPYSWKEFVFHRGCSFKIKSILETELTAGGRESKDKRQTIFSRKVHYHSSWKHDQDVVYCEKLSRAQDQGLGFWQTK